MTVLVSELFSLFVTSNAQHVPVDLTFTGVQWPTASTRTGNHTSEP